MMKKNMSVQNYLELTDSDKLRIENLVFETIKEEMERLFPFLTVEKIEFNDYWEKVDYEANRWKELSGFVLSNGRTFVRLPDVTGYMESEYSNVNYSHTLYEIQENIFEFFRLPNTVMGVTLAWGKDGEYYF
jgi:hypothetical protein